jgi:hypothetical protein
MSARWYWSRLVGACIALGYSEEGRLSIEMGSSMVRGGQANDPSIRSNLATKLHPTRAAAATQMLALVLCFGSCAGAYAFDAAHMNQNTSAVSIIRPAAIIGKEDNRRTFEDYAREHNKSVADVYREYSATGRFHCGTSSAGTGISGTAQVTVRPDVITTAAHLLYTEECKPRSAKHFTDCYFETLPHGSTPAQRYLVKGQVSFGVGITICPQDLMTNDWDDDWAVMRLERPVENVEPYQIDLGPSSNSTPQRGTEIEVAAAQSIDFGGGNTPWIGDCRIRDVKVLNAGLVNSSGWLGTDCSSNEGASGSAVFIRQGDRKLMIGILSRAQTDHYYDHTYYSRGGNTTHAILITTNNNFISALKQLIGVK